MCRVKGTLALLLTTPSRDRVFVPVGSTLGNDKLLVHDGEDPRSRFKPVTEASKDKSPRPQNPSPRPQTPSPRFRLIEFNSTTRPSTVGTPQDRPNAKDRWFWEAARGTTTIDGTSPFGPIRRLGDAGAYVSLSLEHLSPEAPKENVAVRSRVFSGPNQLRERPPETPSPRPRKTHGRL